MRILQVTHGFPPYNIGGSEVYAYNLCQKLAKEHEVFVFYRVNDLHIKEYSVIHTNLDKLEIFTINNTFRLYDSFEMTYKNNAIAEKFASILEQIRPDVVHIQHLLYLSTKLVKEIKKRRIPVIFTLHDYWLICPQGQLFKNGMEVCNGKDSLECIDCVLYQLNIKKYAFNAYYFLKGIVPERLIQLLKNIYLGYCRFFFLNQNKAINLIKERAAYIKSICSQVDLFISPSQFLKRRFIEFGISEDKIALLPYAFNLENFKNSQKITSDKLRFAFMGNLLPAKGTHILIKAFNKIKNANVELRIYGQASSYKGILGNYLRYLKKIAKDRNIKFMGGFDNRNIAKVFSEIDILVVPSVWYENSPLVIQEAFATQTPVIAANIGGIPELIDNGINGLLFNPNDTQDLYRKINSIIENPRLIEDLKQNIKSPKSIEENAKETENIYKALLNQCPSVLV